MKSYHTIIPELSWIIFHGTSCERKEAQAVAEQILRYMVHMQEKGIEIDLRDWQS